MFKERGHSLGWGKGQGGGRGWLPFSDSPPRARGLAILSDVVLRPAGSPFPCWPHAGWQKEGSLKPGLVDDSWGGRSGMEV